MMIPQLSFRSALYALRNLNVVQAEISSGARNDRKKTYIVYECTY